MKKNKGFTLIELLAVIVILSIIALIASPIVVGLIDDARKEAAANSAYGVYSSAQNVFTKVLIKTHGDLAVQVRYTFGTGGSTTIETSTDGSTWVAPNYTTLAPIVAATLALDYNGTKPTTGTLTLGTGGVVTVGAAGITVSGFDCDFSTTTSSFTCN